MLAFGRRFATLLLALQLSAPAQALANICTRLASDEHFIKVVPLGNDQARFEYCRTNSNDCARIGSHDSYDQRRIRASVASLNNAFYKRAALYATSVLATKAAVGVGMALSFLTDSDPYVAVGLGIGCAGVATGGVALPALFMASGYFGGSEDDAEAEKSLTSLETVVQSLKHPMHECTYLDTSTQEIKADLERALSGAANGRYLSFPFENGTKFTGTAVTSP